MENKLTFLGVTFNGGQLANYKDFFKVVEDCDNLKLLSKETFTMPEEEDSIFSNLTYKFVILGKGADAGVETTNEKGESVPADSYLVYLVPTIDKVSDSVILSHGRFYGWDDKSADELRKEFDETDLADAGYGVFLGDFAEEAVDWSAQEDMGWKIPWNPNILNGVTTALPFVNSMLGFYLDKPLNRVGMDGWDFLEMCLTEKTFKDYI